MDNLAIKVKKSNDIFNYSVANPNYKVTIPCQVNRFGLVTTNKNPLGISPKGMCKMLIYSGFD